MTENTENQTETTASATAINPRAGLMRGARLWPDPDGILEGPFTEQGTQMGYVYVYGEESPAVFDGTTWHSVVAAGQAISPDDISNQYYKIIDHSKTNAQYEELARYITGGGPA